MIFSVFFNAIIYLLCQSYSIGLQDPLKALEQIGQLTHGSKGEPNINKFIGYLKKVYQNLTSDALTYRSVLKKCYGNRDPVFIICKHLSSAQPCRCNPTAYESQKRLQIECVGFVTRKILTKFNEIHTGFVGVIEDCKCYPQNDTLLIFLDGHIPNDIVDCQERTLNSITKVGTKEGILVYLNRTVCQDPIKLICERLAALHPCKCHPEDSQIPMKFSVKCGGQKETDLDAISNQIDNIKDIYLRTCLRYRIRVTTKIFKVTITIRIKVVKIYYVKYTKLDLDRVRDQLNDPNFKLTSYETLFIETTVVYALDIYMISLGNGKELNGPDVECSNHGGIKDSMDCNPYLLEKGGPFDKNLQSSFNKSIASECMKHIEDTCSCDPTHFLAYNSIELVCNNDLEMNVMITGINTIVQEFFNIIFVKQIDYLYSVSVKIMYINRTSIPRFADCQTLTPLATMLAEENSAYVFLPLGRQMCLDPIIKLCQNFETHVPCQCDTQFYHPPNMGILCHGTNLVEILRDIRHIQKVLVEQIYKSGISPCSLHRIRISLKDIKHSKLRQVFMVCDQHTVIKQERGDNMRIVLNVPMRSEICVSNGKEIVKLCLGDRIKNSVCRCETSYENYDVRVACAGTNYDLILSGYNEYQEMFEKEIGWSLKFSALSSHLILKDMNKSIKALGNCEDLTLFRQDFTLDDKPIFHVPIGEKICQQSINNFCKILKVHQPCRCVDAVKFLKFVCLGNNVTAILTDINNIQSDFNEIGRLDRSFGEIYYTLKNVEAISWNLADCSNQKHISVSQNDGREVEIKLPFASTICPYSVEMLCEVMKYRKPCRCVQSEEEMFLTTFMCNGLDLKLMLKDANTMRRYFLQTSDILDKEFIWTKLIFQDLTTFPKLLSCNTQTLLYDSMERKEPLFIQKHISLCTLDMIEENNFFKDDTGQLLQNLLV